MKTQIQEKRQRKIHGCGKVGSEQKQRGKHTEIDGNAETDTDVPRYVMLM